MTLSAWSSCANISAFQTQACNLEGTSLQSYSPQKRVRCAGTSLHSHGMPTCTVARVVPGQNLQCRTLPPLCTICTVCWTLTAALQHFETLTVKIQKPRENGFYYRYQNDLSVILLYAIKFNLRNMLYCRKWPAKG